MFLLVKLTLYCEILFAIISTFGIRKISQMNSINIRFLLLELKSKRMILRHNLTFHNISTDESVIENWQKEFDKVNKQIKQIEDFRQKELQSCLTEIKPHLEILK